MRRSSAILTAVAVAGLVAANGSTLTAGNTLPQGQVAGYGESVATGAVVTVISQALRPDDSSRLDSVTFLSTTDVRGQVASMMLKGADSSFGPYPCEFGPYTSYDRPYEAMAITCATPDGPPLGDFTRTGLSVITPTVG